MHAVYKFIDGLNGVIGKTVAWATLLMVLVQFILVVMRYVFAAPDFLTLSTLWWQESIVYMHGFVIMLGAGYTFLHNGHVRVDILYATASETTQDWTDLLGSLIFLLPVCYLVWWSAMPNVALSWANFEGSTETSGIPYKYVLKTTVLVFAVLLALQGISTALKSWMRIMGHEVDDPYRNEESLD